MNKIKINLAGKEYTIQTDESINYVKRLADALNTKIEEFMDQNDTVSITSACMLVSLSLMDDCIKTASDKDNLRKQVIDYLEEVTNSRTQISDLNKQIETLKQEIDTLKAQNDMMSIKLMTLGEEENSNVSTII